MANLCEGQYLAETKVKTLELSVEQVLDILGRAGSQDFSVLKPAEEQLKACEGKRGFYSALLAIAQNRSLATTVRWLAVLCFKNGVDRYWRKMATNAIHEDEKQELRQRLIATFDEPVPQVATQLAVLIGRIARIDCPRQWPELVPTVLEAVQEDNTLVHERSMQVLHQIVKCLASKRLTLDRKVFYQLTDSMFDFLFKIWQFHCTSLWHAVNTKDQSALMHFNNLILTQKVLRRLMVFGFTDFSQSDDAKAFLTAMFEQTDKLLKSKSDLAYCPLLISPRERASLLFTKMLIELQENQSEPFIPFIHPTLDFCTRLLFTDEGQDLVFERLSINCMTIIRAILQCAAYKPSKVMKARESNSGCIGISSSSTLVDEANSTTIEASQRKCDFFTYDTLVGISDRILTHYLPLTQEDLELWDTDPEDFAVTDDTGETAAYSLRAGVERLLCVLVTEFRQSLVPWIVQRIHGYQRLTQPEDLKEIIHKDAVYNAAGLVAFELFDEIDFDDWLQNCLFHELKVQHPNYRILRRRIIQLIGCWVGVKLSPTLRPQLYELFICLLQPSEDLVVRIQTALTMRSTIDDFDFVIESFSPYLDQSFGSLFNLLQGVSTGESKMLILQVLTVLIERLEGAVCSHLQSLATYLPALWDESQDHSLLRCSILSTFQCLVENLREQSCSLHQTLGQIIATCTDITNPQHIYLYEDAVTLWLTLVQCSDKLSEELKILIPCLPPLLDLGTETLRICLKLMESYIFLDPDYILSRHGNEFCNCLQSCMTDLKTEGIRLVYKLVDRSMRVSPQGTLHSFTPMLLDLVKHLNQKDHPEITARKVGILSLIILYDTNVFLQLVDAASQQSQNPDLLNDVLSVWEQAIEFTGISANKKLAGLAAASLLTVQRPLVVRNFSQLVSACVEVLHDICNFDEEAKPIDSCLIASEDQDCNSYRGEDDTPHELRRRAVSRKDIVFSLSLPEYVTRQLQQVEAQYGQETTAQLMQTVDPDVVTQLKNFIN